jgi:hypothetical protein
MSVIKQLQRGEQAERQVEALLATERSLQLDIARLQEARRSSLAIAGKLSKENVRLRIALSEILMDGPIHRAQRIAREALALEQKEDGK